MAGFSTVAKMPPALQREEQQESPAYERREPPQHDMAEGETEEMDEGGQPNVSPEEQAIYDQTVNNALEIIYPAGEQAQVSPQIMQALKGGENPIVNLATASVTIITGLRDSAKKAGQPIPDDVLYHAGVAVVEELAEVAEAAKIQDYSEGDIEQAFYVALDMYRANGTQTGDIDPKGLAQEFDMIRQADAQGRLGEVLPGIEQRMKKG